MFGKKKEGHKKDEQAKIDPALLKEKTDIANLSAHLEDEYRKANISEDSYRELKEKYAQKMKEIEDKISKSADGTQEESQKAEGQKEETIKKKDEKPKEDKQEEAQETAEETAGEKKEDPAGDKENAEKEDKKEKKGLFGKLGKKGEKKEKEEKKEEKQEKEEQKPENQPQEAVQEEKPSDQTQNFTIELEKLKVMLDSVRETKHSTDETIQTLFESVGEIRSLLFQSDAAMKENTSKLERLEDDVSEVKPQEIVKKFRDVSSTLEKYQMSFEKLETKTVDLSEKINQAYSMLKSIGNLENLTNINKEIQKKIDDIKEATKYIERLASKTEKAFFELSKGLEDLILYKSKQDSLDESMRDQIKAMDALNVKFDGYVTKKDIETLREDVVLLQKQVNEINKVLPVVQMNVPENITELRKQKNDIMMFLSSIEEQVKTKRVSIGEYDDIKKKNMEKLKDIEKKLVEEWEKIQPMMQAPKPQKEEEKPKEEKPKEEPAKKEETAQQKSQQEKPPEPAQQPPEPKKRRRRRVETEPVQAASAAQAQPQQSILAPAPEPEEPPVEEVKKRRRKRKKIDAANPAGDFRAESQPAPQPAK